MTDQRISVPHQFHLHADTQPCSFLLAEHRAERSYPCSIPHFKKKSTKKTTPTNLPYFQNHPNLLPWGFCYSWIVPLQIVCPKGSVDLLSSLKNRDHISCRKHTFSSFPLPFRKFKGEILCFGEGNTLIIWRAGWFGLNWREKGKENSDLLSLLWRNKVVSSCSLLLLWIGLFSNIYFLEHSCYFFDKLSNASWRTKIHGNIKTNICSF